MARRNSDATSFTLRLRKKARRSRAVLCRSKSGGRCACTRAQMFKSSSRITIPILNHIGILDVQPLNLTPMGATLIGVRLSRQSSDPVAFFACVATHAGAAGLACGRREYVATAELEWCRGLRHRRL